MEGNLVLVDSGKGKKLMCEGIKCTYGTPRFIAPEVLNGNISPKCDIWSVGVLLYLLVSGIPPFDGSNDNEILHKVLKGEFNFNYQPFKAVSSECKDLIKKLLVLNPDRRLTAQEALNHPWFYKASKINS